MTLKVRNTTKDCTVSDYLSGKYTDAVLESNNTLPLDDTKKVYWVSNKGLVLEKHGEKSYAFLTLGRGSMIAPATEAELVDAGFNRGSFNGFNSDKVALRYAVDVLKGNV